jgi:hypothetical protein
MITRLGVNNNTLPEVFNQGLAASPFVLVWEIGYHFQDILRPGLDGELFMRRI